MRALTSQRQAVRVRAIEQSDVRYILHMVNNAWRVHIRLSPVELSAKILMMPGFLVEDNVGLRGFIVIEPQHPDVALIMAAGLRDTWNVRSYLNLLLPEVQRIAQSESWSFLVHIGNGAWLTNELWSYGFKTREWIIAFERNSDKLPSDVPAPASTRQVHYKDLGAIMMIDALAFDHVWRKSVGSFSEALANADFFIVAEMDGRVVGYEWCELYHQHAHLTRLAVHPHYQGRGIGAQLLQEAVVYALNRDVNLITLNTQEHNHRSRSLYERFGFVYTRQRMPILYKEMGSLAADLSSE